MEVKGDEGKPSELQKYNINKIISDNGVGIIIWPTQWDLFLELVDHLECERLGPAFEIVDKINERWV